MATEALDLPRDHTVTIRLPHRLRVLLRAVRIARANPKLQLVRELADRDDRVLADVGVTARSRAGWFDWLARAMVTHGQSNN